MILTVCTSPCVDVTIEVDSLNVGKLNIIRSKRLTFTGKAINVAIGVKRLGGEVMTTGFMYSENGAMFERALGEENIPHSFVYSEGRVRENYKIIDKKSMLTEINDVGEHVTEEKLRLLIEKVGELSKKAGVVVISGGLPRGASENYYGELFSAVDPRSLKVADAVGGKLLSSLGAGLDLVKPNREELQRMLGRELLDRADMISGCWELLDRGAKIVLLSLGREGAIITDGKKNYYCKSINVAINSTVGAGDGMVAAAALELRRGADLPEILRAGVAAGTATVTTFAPTSFSREKYEEIYKNLTVTEI